MSEADPPIEIPRGELNRVSCLECRQVAWSWPGAGLLDLADVAGDTLASLHPCSRDLEPEDLDEPDYGRVTGSQPPQPS